MTFMTVVTFSQSNNLLWTMTVDVKMDKKLEWEKKMVLFVKTLSPAQIQDVGSNLRR